MTRKYNYFCLNAQFLPDGSEVTREPTVSRLFVGTPYVCIKGTVRFHRIRVTYLRMCGGNIRKHKPIIPAIFVVHGAL